MKSIAKITPTWKVLATFSINFPPAKITTFTVPAPWTARVFFVLCLPSHVTGMSKDVFKPSEAAHDIGVRLGSNTGLQIHCPARYLYATWTGHGDMKTLIRCWPCWRIIVKKQQITRKSCETLDCKGSGVNLLPKKTKICTSILRPHQFD